MQVPLLAPQGTAKAEEDVTHHGGGVKELLEDTDLVVKDTDKVGTIVVKGTKVVKDTDKVGTIVVKDTDKVGTIVVKDTDKVGHHCGL